MSRRGWRRWRVPMGIAIAVVAIAVAAMLANVALLGSAGEDRLGRLRPVDLVLTTAPTETVDTTVAPAVIPNRPPAPTTTDDHHAERSGGDRDHDDRDDDSDHDGGDHSDDDD